MGRLGFIAAAALSAALAGCGALPAPPPNTALNVFPGPPPVYSPPLYPTQQNTLAQSPAQPTGAYGQGEYAEAATVPQANTAPAWGQQQASAVQGQPSQPTYQPSYQPTYQPTYRPTYSPPGAYGRPCAENGSCYGDISALTGRPKTVAVRGYYRKNGTYVRGHYRSHK